MAKKNIWKFRFCRRERQKARKNKTLDRQERTLERAL